MIDEVKVQRAIAELSKMGSPVRVTGYNRDAAIEALRHVRGMIDARIRELESGAPEGNRRGVFAPRDEREVGQKAHASEANTSSPAPSHTNSEGGATRTTPERATMPSPLPSLPHDDGEGQLHTADEARRSAPSPSSPTQSEARRLARIDARDVVVVASFKEQVVMLGDRLVRYGHVLGDQLDALFSTNARSAASSAFTAGMAEAANRNWGRARRDQSISDRFTDAEIEAMRVEVGKCGAKTVRMIAKHSSASLPAA